MKTWARRIKDLEDLGWSAAGLAEHCGIAYSTLSDIKNGRSKEPRGMAAVLLHALEGKTPTQAAAPSRKKKAA